MRRLDAHAWHAGHVVAACEDGEVYEESLGPRLPLAWPCAVEEWHTIALGEAQVFEEREPAVSRRIELEQHARAPVHEKIRVLTDCCGTVARTHQEGELRVGLVGRDDECDALLSKRRDEPAPHRRCHADGAAEGGARFRAMALGQQLMTLCESRLALLCAHCVGACLHDRRRSVEDEEQLNAVLTAQRDHPQREAQVSLSVLALRKVGGARVRTAVQPAGGIYREVLSAEAPHVHIRLARGPHEIEQAGDPHTARLRRPGGASREIHVGIPTTFTFICHPGNSRRTGSVEPRTFILEECT